MPTIADDDQVEIQDAGIVDGQDLIDEVLSRDQDWPDLRITKRLIDEDLSRLGILRQLAQNNCGTGAGGFKPGNTCAKKQKYSEVIEEQTAELVSQIRPLEAEFKQAYDSLSNRYHLLGGKSELAEGDPEYESLRKRVNDISAKLTPLHSEGRRLDSDRRILEISPTVSHPPPVVVAEGVDVHPEVAQALVNSLVHKPWIDESEAVSNRYRYVLTEANREYGRFKFEIRNKYEVKVPPGKLLDDVPNRAGSVYRGMSDEEWQMSLNRGTLGSLGSYNLGREQEGLTFYGSADTAQYYSSGFAPYAFQAAPGRPGVVVEIPRSLVMDSSQHPGIPGSEFAHTGEVPVSSITKRYQVVATSYKPGYIEVVLQGDKITEGSRMSPSIRTKVVEVDDVLTNVNCGTGAGGFKPGNTCAKEKLLKPGLAAGLLPTPRAVVRALAGAAMGAKFSPVRAKVEKRSIVSLRPTEPLSMVSVPELVEKYRKGWPVDPPVVSRKTGAILDGHHRVASALEAGRDDIFVVSVLGNSEPGVDLAIPTRNNCGTGKGGFKPGNKCAKGGELESKLTGLKGKIAAAAQEEYDDWQQDEDGMDCWVGSGGICDSIARRIGDVLADAGIDTIDGGQDGDDHAWLIAYTDDEAYGVDIPPGVYETGGGYSWEKIPDVKIEESDVDIWEMDREYLGDLIDNAFCPTGLGGGIKNTCSSSRTDRGEILDYSRAVKDSIYFAKEKSGTRTCSLEHHCEPFAQVLQRELKVRKIPSTIEWKQSKSEPIHHVFVRTEDGLYIDAGGVFGSEEALLKNFSRANDLIDEGWEEYTGNAFCPTGKGGGIDNSCPSRKIGISDKQREMLRDFRYIKERKGLFWVRKSSDLYDRMIGSEEFSDLVRSLPQRVGTVYRGVSLDWDEANFNPGDSLELDKATATTAKSEVKALDYANENFVPEEKKGGKNRIPVVFEFRNASGADLRSVGESSEDLQEVILPRGDVFIIESVTKGNIGSKYNYIPGGLKVVLTRKLTSNSNLSENAFCPTGKGGGIKNTCAPRHSALSPVRNVRLECSDEAHRQIEKILGRSIPKELIPNLVGAQPGSRVVVGLGDRYQFDSVGITVTHKKYEAERELDANGDMWNHSFYVDPKTTGKGLGLKVFADQVDSCAELGVRKIRTWAARNDDPDPAQQLNGYYTWPRLGYDAPLEEVGYNTAQTIWEKFPDAKRVSDLMKTKAGRDWWKENGDTVPCTFDLKPDSLSRRVLDAYVTEKREKRTSRAAARLGSGGRGAAGPDLDRDRGGKLATANEFFHRDRLSILRELAANAFCPTGKGGGVDPTCSPGRSSLLTRDEALYKWGTAESHEELMNPELRSRMSEIIDQEGTYHEDLYRGMGVQKNFPLLKLKAGDSFSIGPSSTSLDRTQAESYTMSSGIQGQEPLLLKFLGARGFDFHKTRYAASNDAEIIVKGNFKVIRKEKVNDAWGYPITILTVTKWSTPSKRHVTLNALNAFCPTGKGGGIKNTCSRYKTTSRGETLVGAVRDPETKKWLVDGEEAPEHVQKAGIPPAWTEVYVNQDPDGALLATGLDKKGRVQARYSDSHNARQAEVKFKRVTELRQKRQLILAELDEDAKDPALRENAECLRVVVQTGIRPGGKGDTMADYQSYGATTLEGRHVRIGEGGSVSLVFVAGKSHGQEKTYPIRDKRTAAMLRRRAEAAGDDGKLFQTDAGSLASYSKTKDGGGFKTKDHRTALGTETAIAAIEEMPVPKTKTEYKKAVAAVGDAVSNTLGNTRSVALKSYIDPVVFQSWRRAAGV